MSASTCFSIGAVPWFHSWFYAFTKLNWPLVLRTVAWLVVPVGIQHRDTFRPSHSSANHLCPFSGDEFLGNFTTGMYTRARALLTKVSTCRDESVAETLDIYLSSLSQ